MEELEITKFQTERCLPDKGEVWAEYPMWILHFVFRGSGFFNGRPVGAGQMFLIRPNEKAVWKPDPEDPWEYGYVNGSGDALAGMLADMGLKDRSVAPFRFLQQTETLFQLGQFPDDPLYRAGLFTAICRLQITTAADETQSAPLSHLRDAVRFIESRSGRTTAAACAEYLHLSRSYLRALFDEHYHQSLQSYIIDCRMNYAASLLRYSKMTVSEIASMTGYRDPLQFSKAFSKRMGKSPRAYRKDFLRPDEGNLGP